MVDPTTFGWALLAVLGAMFVAQYGRSIKMEDDDVGTSASSETIIRRAAGATSRVGAALRRMFSITADYVAEMTWTALVAFGVTSAAFVYVTIGMLQFDPVSWFYVGVTALASVKAFGIFQGDTVTALIIIASLAIAMYAAKRFVMEVV